MSKKAIAVIVVIIVLVLIIVGKSHKPVADTGTGAIKIGFVGPLSGDCAAYGEPARNSTELITKQINAKGGINGRQVEIIYEDAKCDGKTAALAAQKLISVDGVKVIIGGLASGETLAMAPIAEQNKVLLISPGSSAPAISEAGDYIFRLAPSDVYSALKLAEVMSEKGYKKVALLSEQTDYAQGIGKAFVVDAKAKGIEVVYDQSFATETTDFKSFTTKINDSGAEAIFINPQTGATAARIAKALRTQGNKMQFYVFFMTGDDFIKSGSSADGTIVLDQGAIANQAVGDKFFAEYKAAYKEPTYPLFAAISSDTTNILFNAITKVGYDATKIKDYLYKMPAYTGITGNLTLDKNGDPVGNNLFVVKQVQNGKLLNL